MGLFSVPRCGGCMILCFLSVSLCEFQCEFLCVSGGVCVCGIRQGKYPVKMLSKSEGVYLRGQ